MSPRVISGLFAALLVSSAIAACGGTHYVSTRQADAVLISAQSPAEVRAAIVRALADRRFSTESETAGRILARHEHGDERLRIAVEYTQAQYVVRYVDSAGLKTQPGAGGEVLVDSTYASWTNKLKHAIDDELKRPAREAAESARREREYQLLLQAQRTAEAQANAQAAQLAAQPPPPVGPDPNVALPVAPPPVVFQSQTTIRQSDQTFTCCINGALYNCPGEAAFKECLSSGPSKCSFAGKC